MADFVVQPLGWVNTPQGNHGRYGTKVVRGFENNFALAEVVDAKPGQGVTPIGTPEMVWNPLPDANTSQPHYISWQVDTVIEVDASCALVIGWYIQKQDGIDDAGEADGGTITLTDVQRWNHVMWAINPLGDAGPAFDLGYRIEHNYGRRFDDGGPWQTPEEHGLRWPAHFGIPMGSSKVRLPGSPDTVVAVAGDLSVSVDSGPADEGFDLGCAAFGDPNTQNGVMAYFEPGVSPANGVLRFADGTDESFTGPGVPLCNPVDLGGGTSWAWLSDFAGLALVRHQIGVGTTTEPLELPDYLPADPTRTYTLSRFTGPAKSLFLVMRTEHDPETDHLHWKAHTVLCSFAGPRALTGWTQVRLRTDQDIYPG